ncbi:hypothetical protein [Nonomuraea sp. NPDC046570]|uniref:hypothetical protein n=1 Tax=Nonomuraea sp. NPDC046570 TaxID=3155255 RepID=UPI0034057D7E
MAEPIAVGDAARAYLRERFRRDRIYLLAHSGGMVPSVLAVQRHPELFRRTKVSGDRLRA